MTTRDELAEAADDPVEDGEVARRQRRAYAAGLIGTTIEYYDFILYGTAASVVLGPIFFTGSSPAVGVVAAFGTLAVGYVARPFGAVVFGHFGDRVGRKSVLLVTLILMGLSTLLIGLLPPTAAIGSAAPILLVVLRLIQGIAVGGEWAGSVLVTVEHAGERNRGFLGSATSVGASVGFLLSFLAFTAVSVTLTKEQLLSWGWRLPFLATVVLVAAGLFIRLRLEETPVMKQHLDEELTQRRLPIVETLRDHWRSFLLAVGLWTGPFVTQAVATSYAISYAPTVGVSTNVLLAANISLSAVQIVSIPFFARLSDRYGRKAVYVPAVATMIVTAMLIFPAINSGSTALILTVYSFHFMVLHAAALGALAPILSELFPTRVRYTGVSISFQLTGTLGGLGPLLAASVVAAGVQALWFGVFLGLLCVISLVCVLRIRETRTVDLNSI